MKLLNGLLPLFASMFSTKQAQTVTKTHKMTVLPVQCSHFQPDFRSGYYSIMKARKKSRRNKAQKRLQK